MPPTPNEAIDVRGRFRECPDCARQFSGEAAFCPFDGVPLVASRAAAWSDSLVGTTIDGRYEVLEILGEGGMGRVYRVRHAPLDRLFAMKVLRRDLAAHDDLSARFLHEARATAAVKHPNVVQITDFGRTADGIPYFIMELLSGKTLTESLRGQPLTRERIVPILRQIASALGAAHAAGVIHRDLKPDNVFLIHDARGDAVTGGTPSQVWPITPELRVVDFGAAKILGSDRITRAGIVFGTPHYMSPEQASGQPIDRRADVYALGVMLYEMLTGRVPFEADTYMGVLSQHMFAPLKPPSEVHPAARDMRPLEAIAVRCLAKRPDDRFDSMEAVLLALDGLAPARTTLDAPPAAGDPRPSSVPRRTGLAVWIAAGALVAGTLAGAAIFASRGSPEARPDAPPTSATPSAAAHLAAIAPSVAPSVDLLPPVPTPPPPPPASADAPPSPSARRPGPRRPSPFRPGTPLDDVGDPFAHAR